MKNTSTTRTAQIAYTEHRDAVLAKLEQLKKIVKNYDNKGKAATDWGYAGSMEHISNQLSEILENFSND